MLDSLSPPFKGALTALLLLLLLSILTSVSGCATTQYAASPRAKFPGPAEEAMTPFDPLYEWKLRLRRLVEKPSTSPAKPNKSSSSQGPV